MCAVCSLRTSVHIVSHRTLFLDNSTTRCTIQSIGVRVWASFSLKMEHLKGFTRVSFLLLPGIAGWRCQTQRRRCNRCRWGRWWTWGPWPPAPSWWDETRGETGGTPSTAQSSWNTRKKKKEKGVSTSSWKHEDPIHQNILNSECWTQTTCMLRCD